MLLFGADPEFFITKSGKHVSAVGLIGGSKEKPLLIDDKGNALLEDNVAVEFNIQPADNAGSLRTVINKMIQETKKRLPGYGISKQSAWSFDSNELNTPESRVFGCDPDFNAWTLEKNKKPWSKDKNLRSAGGHIHIGCSTAIEKPIEVIRACDLFLGIPSVRLDDSSVRRELYGMAGSFRKKEYGVEYRSLSNFWIFSKNYTEWAFQQVNKAIAFVEAGKTIDVDNKYLIQKCINTSDKELANILCYNWGI